MAMVTNSKDHHQHMQTGGGGKWRDLGETHIVRAASVYTNIPLSRKKELSAVLKMAQDKTLVVQLSARGAIAKELTLTQGSANA